MAPNLAPSQHDLIRAMILDKKLKAREIASVAECSECSIKAIRSNLHEAPPNDGGRPQSITPPVLEVLCEHLLEKPELYLEEMAMSLSRWAGTVQLSKRKGGSATLKIDEGTIYSSRLIDTSRME
jgi:hypothetical protein